MVHTAAKIRKQWEKLVERVLQHKLVRIVRIPGAHGVAVEDRILVCMVGGSELYEAPCSKRERGGTRCRYDNEEVGGAGEEVPASQTGKICDNTWGLE